MTRARWQELPDDQLADVLEGFDPAWPDHFAGDVYRAARFYADDNDFAQAVEAAIEESEL